jgi:AcrR family transcriptional regulator
VTRMSVHDRREQLVEAAIRVMTRDGVAKATTRAIAAEAGMNLGLFHYCFDSREQLLLMVTEVITDRGVEAVRGLFTGRTDIRASIRESLLAFWRHFEQNSDVHLVNFELTHYALRTEGSEALARKQYEHYLAVHIELLELAAASSDIEWTAPLPALARYTSALLDGMNLAWLVDRNSADSVAALDLLVDHLAAHARPRSGT